MINRIHSDWKSKTILSFHWYIFEMLVLNFLFKNWIEISINLDLSKLTCYVLAVQGSISTQRGSDLKGDFDYSNIMTLIERSIEKFI